MSLTTKSPARLWVLLARKEPSGVIFRRGPSKQVLLIRWNTQKDTFEVGQWFKGRVYERRCDLSSSGELLIYFAAKQKPPMYSWTAISRPPYFTALALWPKGDCWNGGGWFVNDRNVRLNHSPLEAKLDANFHLGPIKVAGYAECGGEDATVWDIVRKRDGWVETAKGKSIDRGGVRGWGFNPPQIWRRAHPKNANLSLEMAITGIGGKGLPWYQINYRVLTGDDTLLDLGQTDWAEWDFRGQLVYAQSGCLFHQRVIKSSLGSAKRIADFNELRFEEVPPPPKAQRW
jgi:hypothetical protein